MKLVYMYTDTEEYGSRHRYIISYVRVACQWVPGGILPPRHNVCYLHRCFWKQLRPSSPILLHTSTIRSPVAVLDYREALQLPVERFSSSTMLFSRERSIIPPNLFVLRSHHAECSAFAHYCLTCTKCSSSSYLFGLVAFTFLIVGSVFRLYYTVSLFASLQIPSQPSVLTLSVNLHDSLCVTSAF